MDQIIITLIHMPPTYLLRTAKINVEYEKYHIASFSIYNTSYVLFMNTAQNLWAHRHRNLHPLIYLHEGKHQ